MLLGGIAGPALFAVLVLLCGALRPDYDHFAQFISELGEDGGEFAALMNYLGFMVPAALILLFAAALPAQFARSTHSVAGALLVGLFALGMFTAGVFSCDATCTPATPTMEQRLHDVASIVAFPSLILGALVWGVLFLRTPGWRSFGHFSIGCAVVSVALLVAMVASTDTRSGTGALQRGLLGVLFLWLSLMALRLWRKSSADESMQPVA